MSTTEPPGPAFDQIVKGNVTIKKLSSHRYRITFSKIGKFLVYQVWDKDNAGNLNSNRSVVYLSVKEWVENFNNLNKRLEEKNKPLFTPTTIMETEDYECFAFVLDKANVNSFGRVVFTVSTKQIKLESNNTSSKDLIKIPCGKFNNMRFDIDAYSGDGVVFFRSDCWYPNVRVYDPIFTRYPSSCSSKISSGSTGYLSSSDLDTIWTNRDKDWTPAEICKVNPNSILCNYNPPIGSSFFPPFMAEPCFETRTCN